TAGESSRFAEDRATPRRSERATFAPNDFRHGLPARISHHVRREVVPTRAEQGVASESTAADL
ncbi:MAG: hypothetical protein ACKVWV_16325, partial [Planctomycetota bacterium]